MSGYFPPGWLFLWDCGFAFFFLIRKIYAGYVNVATGKSETGRVKFYRFKGEDQFRMRIFFVANEKVT